MSNNLRIEVKVMYGDKTFYPALEFNGNRLNTKTVSHELWLLWHNIIRTLQKQGILDECYFWETTKNESQVEQIESTSSDSGNATYIGNEV